MKNRIDWRWIFKLLLLIVIAVLLYKYKPSIISYSLFVLSVKDLNVYLAIGAAAIIFVHKYKMKELSFEWDNSFSDFYEQFKKVAGLITKPAAIASSYALLKGLYIEMFDISCQSCFFPKFQAFDITFLWGVALYLISNTTYDIVRKLIDIVYIKNTETPEGKPNV